jgi:subtilase family serine protease
MKTLTLGVTAATAVVVGSLASAATATAAPPAAGASHRAAHTCAAVPAGYAACTALVRIDSSGKPAVTGSPSGYGPADLRNAYALTTTGGGQTVAIVDAYDDPTAEADLGVYRSQFGLASCTTGNGCFKKVNQTGGSSLPKANAGWATEISLDLDMVSAACPGCHILLVEATSASFNNLGAAVNYAAKQPGVAAISNSYGGSDSAETSAYDHPGIAITASTGDNGYGVESPASYDSVIAVGGTSLKKTSSGWTESAWSGAGSGCSTKNPNPAWQTGTQCNGKANADVSAVADPNTGVAVYDSTAYQGRKGWQVYGGTSVSSPFIASLYAMGGNLSGYPAKYTWQNSGSLHDVTSGSNGSCTTSVWCTAGTGWDGPTGLGSPLGTGTAAF